MENIQRIEDDIETLKEVSIKTHYPFSEDYEYEVQLVRINLDEEKKNDLMTNNGFEITKRQNLRKDLKSDEGIFSSKFGRTLQDMNAFANRYKCKCGHYEGKLYSGLICEYCKTEVKYVSDNFEYFGWISIKEPYALIHPNLYKSLQCLIGTNELESIIGTDPKIDENGFRKEKQSQTTEKGKKKKKESPFIGIGMMEFKDRILEILEYYKNKKPNKIEFYNDIMENMDKLFFSSIPVFTTQLRPFGVDGIKFTFEGVNATYNILASQALRINKDKLYINKNSKPAMQILYAMQMGVNDIYTAMEKLLSQKTGYVRTLVGGRFNFCTKVVIVPDPSLEIDEIRLPYMSMLEIFQQRIINILSKTYIPSEAYKIWDGARNEYNPNIATLINSIIDSEYVGVFFGRNPSICSESIRQMRVVGINNDYSCSVPLQILTGFNADFDGDTMYSMWINNKEFLDMAKRIFNPRYAGQISRNDGLFNNNVNLQSDTMISLNSFAFLGREYYSQEQIEAINRAKASPRD